jgi:uncharacterized protein
VFNDFVGFKIPPFPENIIPSTGTKCDENEESGEKNEKKFNLKEYPSIYLSLFERETLIGKISEAVGDSILYDHKLINVKLQDKEGIHELEVLCESKTSNQRTASFLCKYLVLAGGKFFPITLLKVPRLKRVFRRFEIGARLIGPNNVFESFYPKKKDLNDPKWLLSNEKIGDNKLQVKTFCMCRDAELVICSHEDFHSYSGRADCPSTGLTNFGLNLVVRDERLLNFQEFIEKTGETFDITLNEALDESLLYWEGWMGEACGKAYRDALKILVTQFQIQDVEKIRMVGPTVEGVGFYPEINSKLQIVENETIYAIGDCGGAFRGIVSAMISGAYAAENLLEQINH